MVDKKLDVVSSFLKDNILSTFLLIFFLYSHYRVNGLFKTLIKISLRKKELEEFNEKSNIRKEEILKSQNEQN